MNNEFLDRLNASYGIDREVSFGMGDNGMPVVFIANKYASAELSLYGGHMLSYKPEGFEDLLWVSKKSLFKEGTPIRGGIPLCWPWFGPHPVDRKTFYSHGFARRKPWQIIDSNHNNNGSTTVTLALDGGDASDLGWPHTFRAELIVTVGCTLMVTLRSFAPASESVTISAALHTYFVVSDIEKISITGLDGCEYGDDASDGALKKQIGVVTFSGEVDRNYRKTGAVCKLTDPIRKRVISVAKEGSRTTVVWNPWIEKAQALSDFGDDEYREMVCIEAVNAFDDTVLLNPGEQHELTQIISVENL